MRSSAPRKIGGFTLVEIMIVVVIVGLLAAMAIPAFKKVRINSYASRIANDFRIFSAGFETHALEVGNWPSDGMGNSLPPTAQPYFENTSWYQPAPNGGYWDWEVGRFGVVAAVGLSQGDGTMDIEIFMKVDAILDDGNLGTGQFIRTGNRYAYILEN